MTVKFTFCNTIFMNWKTNTVSIRYLWPNGKPSNQQNCKIVNGLIFLFNKLYGYGIHTNFSRWLC